MGMASLQPCHSLPLATRSQVMGALTSPTGTTQHVTCTKLDTKATENRWRCAFKMGLKGQGRWPVPTLSKVLADAPSSGLDFCSPISTSMGTWTKVSWKTSAGRSSWVWVIQCYFFIRSSDWVNLSHHILVGLRHGYSLEDWVIPWFVGFEVVWWHYILLSLNHLGHLILFVWIIWAIKFSHPVKLHFVGSGSSGSGHFVGSGSSGFWITLVLDHLGEFILCVLDHLGQLILWVLDHLGQLILWFWIIWVSSFCGFWIIWVISSCGSGSSGPPQHHFVGSGSSGSGHFVSSGSSGWVHFVGSGSSGSAHFDGFGSSGSSLGLPNHRISGRDGPGGTIVPEANVITPKSYFWLLVAVTSLWPNFWNGCWRHIGDDSGWFGYVYLTIAWCLGHLGGPRAWWSGQDHRPLELWFFRALGMSMVAGSLCFIVFWVWVTNSIIWAEYVCCCCQPVAINS